MIRLILSPFGPFRDVGAIARIPAFDRHPGHDLAILLNDLALVVHQDERVVGRLVRMILVTLAGEREHAPDLGLAAGVGEDLGLLAGHAGGGLVHLLRVVHDAVGAVFREDDQIHARQADLHADHHLGDLAGIGQHFRLGVEPRHLVVDDGDADGVVAAADITVKHVDLLFVEFARVLWGALVRRRLLVPCHLPARPRAEAQKSPLRPQPWS